MDKTIVKNKKVSIICLLKILQEFSDAEHPLTQNEIINYMKEYFGLDLERKTIHSNIEDLTQLGYTIKAENRKGVYLDEREFDENQIHFLTDAIFTSRSIDGKTAKELWDKISETLSENQRKEYTHLFKAGDITRTENMDVFWNIEEIQRAINTGKQIKFDYLKYNMDGEPEYRSYYVSPYFMTISNSRYYAVCNMGRYNNHSTWRIDYMYHIEVLDKPVKPVEEITSLGPDFSISKYINEHVYSFAGDIIDAKIEIEDSKGITAVKDWFGNGAVIYKENDKLYANIKSERNSLYYWLLQYQESILLAEPAELKEDIIKILRKSLRKYKAENKEE